MIPKKRSGRLCFRISTSFDFIQSRNPETTAIVGTFYVLARNIHFNSSSYIDDLIAHPAIVTDELKKLTSHYVKRELEYHLFNDPVVKQVFHSEGIHLISWREIRDLQRLMNRSR